MRPKDFANAIKTEVVSLADKFTGANLTLLVHYLVQEELGMVSFEKLLRALSLGPTNRPLQ